MRDDFGRYERHLPPRPPRPAASPSWAEVDELEVAAREGLKSMVAPPSVRTWDRPLSPVRRWHLQLRHGALLPRGPWAGQASRWVTAGHRRVMLLLAALALALLAAGGALVGAQRGVPGPGVAQAPRQRSAPASGRGVTGSTDAPPPPGQAGAEPPAPPGQPDQTAPSADPATSQQPGAPGGPPGAPLSQTAAAAAGGTPPPGPPGAGAGPVQAGPVSASPGVVMWGMNDSQTENREAALGRRFALVHVYHYWNDTIPSARDRQLVAEGHGLIVSLAAHAYSSAAGHMGTPVSWKAIASGQYDGWVLAQMTGLNALPEASYLSFDPEPDLLGANSCSKPGNHPVCGPEFVAAWNHLHALAQGHGLTQLRWLFTLEGTGSFGGTPPRGPMYYPGAANVDVLGFDVYNTNTCTGATSPWTKLGDLLAPGMAWAGANAPSKNVMVPEFASSEGAAGAKAQWINDGAAWARTQPRLRALVWHDTGGNRPAYGGCNFAIDTSASSFNAYRGVGLNPYFEAAAY
jgi:hypothetical protein